MHILLYLVILSTSFYARAVNRHCAMLAGQSNMVGATTIPHNLAYLTFSNSIPRVLVLGNDDVFKNYFDPYDNNIGQVDSVSSDDAYYAGFGVGAGYGPARALASRITSQRLDVSLVLIPCAKGASGITQWQRNLSASTLYGSCLRRYNLVATYFRCTSSSFLFYQGEQEADTALNASTWGAQFAQLVTDLRSDMVLPSLPVVYVKLPNRVGAHPWVPYWDDVRTTQAAVSISNTSRVNLDDIDVISVTTNNFTLYDSMHLSVAQYNEVGRRIADALLPYIP